MAGPKFVPIPADAARALPGPLLGEDYAEIEAAAERARSVFAGRAIWHVNSTRAAAAWPSCSARCCPTSAAPGSTPAGWSCASRPSSSQLTKRIHNNLHGDPGDGGALGEERARALRARPWPTAPRARPAAAGGRHRLPPRPADRGARRRAKAPGRTWSGAATSASTSPNELGPRAWDFLRPYVEQGRRLRLLPRASTSGTGSTRERVCGHPALDRPLLAEEPGARRRRRSRRSSARSGSARRRPGAAPAFIRADGTPGGSSAAPRSSRTRRCPTGARWSPRSRAGTGSRTRAACSSASRGTSSTADLHLVLAGPATAAVADDPEGAAVCGEVADSWRRLPAEVRRRVHLVSLPMDDLDENAAMVNALQRRAAVVVQKSLAEGFGLTVAEAMWKGGRWSPAGSAASRTRSSTASQRRPGRRPARPRGVRPRRRRPARRPGARRAAGARRPGSG